MPGLNVFSSLTRRIVVLNLAGLVVLVAGILYLNQFRAGLIDARVESLHDAGRDHRRRDRRLGDRRHQLDHHRSGQAARTAGGQSLSPLDQFDSSISPINPEQVAPMLRRLISPTRTRARIYDRDGTLLVDSLHLYSRGQILRYDLPPPDDRRADLARPPVAEP